jgi:hypothetical protein
MTAAVLQPARLALIVAALLCAVLFGMMSHQRATQNTRAQGLVRAGVLLTYLAIAWSAFIGLTGWDASLRVFPPLAVVVYSLIGIITDARDELRKRPTTGPLGVARRIIRRIQRRP